jgi:Ni,Fe-hydrogenase maturation factor
MGTSKTEDRIVVLGIRGLGHDEDAVSRRVVERVAARELPNVVAMAATQLIPEFATVVASSRATIFVCGGAEQQETVEVRELFRACPLSRRLHEIGPRELLALTRNCYGHSPLAWSVTLPAARGGGPQRRARDWEPVIQEAVRGIEQLIQQLTTHQVSHA